MSPLSRLKYDPLITLWSKIVRARDGHKCQRCFRSKAAGFRIEAAHILSRGAYRALKYEPANGVSLCFLCHKWYDAHKDGAGRAWVSAWMGQERWDRLLILAQTIRRVDKIATRIKLILLLKEHGGDEARVKTVRVGA